MDDRAKMNLLCGDGREPGLGAIFDECFACTRGVGGEEIAGLVPEDRDGSDAGAIIAGRAF